MLFYRSLVTALIPILFVCFTLWAQESTTIIAGIQLQTTDAGNFEKIRALVKQAKVQGAELVILPEESLFGWLNPSVFLEAEPIPGVFSEKFAEIARSECIWLAAGLSERGPKAQNGAMENAHQAYNSGILINPSGEIVLHHRQYQVVPNAFEPRFCKQILNQEQCNYIPGELSDITVVDTTFGKTSILICSDAFMYPTHEALDVVKQLKPNLLIIFWGITASQKSECETREFNAMSYLTAAAQYLERSYVIGINSIGTRYHGKFLPSEYCGGSGCASPGAITVETAESFEELVFFKIKIQDLLE